MANEKNSLPGWREFIDGFVVSEPGNIKGYRTGDWRSRRPILNEDRCVGCGLCWIFCPDASKYKTPKGHYDTNLFYCKGCGICSIECPTSALNMVEEGKGS